MPKPHDGSAKSLFRKHSVIESEPRQQRQSGRELQLSHYADWLHVATSRNGRPFTPGTIKGYMRAARLLARWLDEQEIGGDLTAACDPEVLNRFLRWYLESHDVNGTAFVQRSLRTLFRWLEREEGVTSPFRSAKLDVYSPRTHKPKVLAREFIAELLDSCKGTDFTSVRDEAIIRVMLDGLRVGEALAMRVQDVPTLTDPVLRVAPHKGDARFADDSGRRVRLADETVRALQRWLRVRLTHPLADSALRDVLWLGKGRAEPWGYDGVRLMLQRRCRKLGYPEAATTHMFRHTFSHDFLASGGSPLDLAEHNGWSSLAMAQRYGKDMAEDRAIAARERLGRLY